MRFIISELPYERPIARGLWRYSLDGRPTGAVEQWRLSAAHEGFQFLRVDLDARAAPSGRSYLYHLVLDEAGRPLRLKYRFWEGSHETVGNIRLEPDAVLQTAGRAESRQETILAVPAGYRFWFPACSALGLLAKVRRNGESAAVHLQLVEDESGGAELKLATTRLRQEERLLTVTAEDVAMIVDLRWEGQQRTIGLNAAGWPVRMTRQDRLTAKESQFVAYQRITAPGDDSQVRQAGQAP